MSALDPIRYNLKLKTAPTVEPVSVQEFISHRRIDTDSGESALITSLIKAARQHLDGPKGILARALNTQTWTLYLDEFPSEEFILPLNPVISVTSVKYYDESNTLQTLSSQYYDLVLNDEPAKVSKSYDYSWPLTYRRRNAVEIEFVAGYGTAAADVPEALRVAILMLAGDMYERRESFIEAPYASNVVLENQTFKRLIQPYIMYLNF